MQSLFCLAIVAALLSCALSSPPYPRRNKATWIPVLYDPVEFPEYGIDKMDSLQFTKFIAEQNLPLYKTLVDYTVDDNSWFHPYYFTEPDAVQFVPFDMAAKTSMYSVTFWNKTEAGEVIHSSRFTPYPPTWDNAVVVPPGDDIDDPKDAIPARAVDFPSFHFWKFLELYFGPLYQGVDKEPEFTREYGHDADPIDIPILYRSSMWHASNAFFFQNVDSQETTAMVAGMTDGEKLSYLPMPYGLFHFVAFDFEKLKMKKVVQENLDSEGNDVPIMHYYVPYKYDEMIDMMFFPKPCNAKAASPSAAFSTPASSSSATVSAGKSSSAPAVNNGKKALSADSPAFVPSFASFVSTTPPPSSSSNSEQHQPGMLSSPESAHASTDAPHEGPDSVPTHPFVIQQQMGQHPAYADQVMMDWNEVVAPPGMFWPGFMHPAGSSAAGPSSMPGQYQVGPPPPSMPGLYQVGLPPPSMPGLYQVGPPPPSMPGLYQVGPPPPSGAFHMPQSMPVVYIWAEDSPYISSNQFIKINQ